MKINYIHKTIPYEHQQKAFFQAWDKEFFAYLAEMGTGKTKMLIDDASNLHAAGKLDRVLLIAPNNVHSQWHNEQIPTHSPVEYESFLWKTTASKSYKNNLAYYIKKEIHGLQWFCVNIETFSTDKNLHIFKDFLTGGKSMVVIDEATLIKNPEAKRTQNILHSLGTLEKQCGRVVGFTPYAKYRRILSGGLVNNSPYDVFAPFNFLQFNFFKMNFWSFKARYGIEKQDTNRITNKNFYRSMKLEEIQNIRRLYSLNSTIDALAIRYNTNEQNIKYILENPKVISPFKHLDELKISMAPHSFIVKKSDCLDLPDKTYEKIVIDMPPEHKKIYKNLKEELLAQYLGEELTVKNKLSLVTRLQQITSGYFPYVEIVENVKGDQEEQAITQLKKIGVTNPKIKGLISSLNEHDFSTPVTIWTRFTVDIETMQEEINKKFPHLIIAKYYGVTSTEERDTIKENFQLGKVDVLLIQIQSGCRGLNLQRGNTAYYFCNSWSYDERSQSEDRFHRLGQKNPCTYIDIVMKDSIDERILDVLKAKKSLNEYFKEKSFNEFLQEE